MRRFLALILGAALAVNGLFMLADPAVWYALVPGVPMTGPLNAHFARDIGCAYLVAGTRAGAENIIRLMAGLARRATPGEFRLRAAPINGMPGFIVAEPGGGVETIALEIAEGKIAAIYLVRNPDKLRGVAF